MSVHGIKNSAMAAQAQYAEWLRHLQARRMAEEARSEAEDMTVRRRERQEDEAEEDILDKERQEDEPEQEQEEQGASADGEESGPSFSARA